MNDTPDLERFEAQLKWTAFGMKRFELSMLPSGAMAWVVLVMTPATESEADE